MSQAVVNPVKFLRASQEYFFKIQFKNEQILYDLDYYPREFYSPMILIGVYKNLENFVVSHVLDHTGCYQPG